MNQAVTFFSGAGCLAWVMVTGFGVGLCTGLTGVMVTGFGVGLCTGLTGVMVTGFGIGLCTGLTGLCTGLTGVDFPPWVLWSTMFRLMVSSNSQFTTIVDKPSAVQQHVELSDPAWADIHRNSTASAIERTNREIK